MFNHWPMSNIVIDPHVRQLMESAATGMAAREFIASEFGKYLVAKASAEVDEALSELISANPEDARGIAAIQNRIHIPQAAIQWLMESITEGENAMRELDDEQ